MWDIRYRPLKFQDVLGQSGTAAVLKSRLRNKTALDTSYIFFGGSGCGKTTLGRILARAMLCQNLDLSDPEPCNECDNCQAILTETSGAFVEKDAASQGTVEHVRAIVDELAFGIFGAAKRIYLFDECHRMSRDAQDVLLKPIEDKRMVAIFCTTEPEKVRGPIRTRCEEYGIRRVTREDIATRMKWVCDQEGVKYEDDAINTVVDYCGGQVREVLNKLEMISHMGEITMGNVREYLNLSVVSTYYDILLSLSSQPEKAISLIDKACERVTPEEVASGLAEAAMNSFRQSNKMFSEFTYCDRELGQKLYAMYGPQTIKLAEYFLRSRYVSQVGLICDIIGLAQVISAGQPLPSPTEASAPGIPAIAPLSPSSIPVQASVQTRVTSQVSISPPTPVAAPAPTVKPATPLPTYKVGNLGQDPHALTELDDKVLGATTKPTKAALSQKDLKFVGGDEENDLIAILTPGEWKREFEHRFLRR